jgi:hypothetical protein
MPREALIDEVETDHREDVVAAAQRSHGAGISMPVLVGPDVLPDTL